ncbi:unnamed protein product, partial [Mesorhabditis spiculigera]
MNATTSPRSSNTSHITSEGVWNWTSQQRSAIFSASWGALISTLIAGFVADRCRPKLVISLALFFVSLTTSLSPYMLGFGYYAFFVTRTLLEFSGGFIFPASSSIASRWFPPTERSTLASVYSMGSTLGSSITPLIVAGLCTSPFGWESLFYVFAIVGFLFQIPWTIVVTNKPSKNRHISEVERKYLESELHFGPLEEEDDDDEELPEFPWKRLLFSAPLLANYACEFSYQFTQAATQHYLPSFFSEKLGFTIGQNGLYTTLPFTLNVLFGILWGGMADYLKENKVMTNTGATKMFQAIDGFGSGISLILLTVIPSVEDSRTALIFLLLFGLTFPAGVSGYFTSMISICPQYAGSVISISRGYGVIGCMITPWVLTFFEHLGFEHKWFYFYGLAACFQIVSGFLFLVYGTSEEFPECRERRSSNPRREEMSINSTKLTTLSA